VAAAAGSSPLLAQARDGPWEPDRDCAVEQADVDPELEGVRRRDSQQVAFDEAALELAALGGRVSGAVRREAPPERAVPDPVGGEAVNELGRPPALREADRSLPALDERGHDPGSLPERARALSELLVQERRVPQRHGALGPRRPVVLHDGCFDTGQSVG
jgi:hypothetical protein